MGYVYSVRMRQALNPAYFRAVVLKYGGLNKINYILLDIRHLAELLWQKKDPDNT